MSEGRMDSFQKQVKMKQKKINLSVREIHFVFCKTFYVLHNIIYVNFN